MRQSFAVVLYFVGTPESALMIERVGFTGDKLIRVEEHPPDTKSFIAGKGGKAGGRGNTSSSGHSEPLTSSRLENP